MIDDEKTAIILRRTLFEYFRNIVREFGKLRYEDFYLHTKKKTDLVLKEIIKKTQLDPLEFPIFDYEL